MLTSESTAAAPTAPSSAGRVRAYRKRQKEEGRVAMTVYLDKEMAQEVRDLADGQESVPGAIITCAIAYLCRHLKEGRVSLK